MGAPLAQVLACRWEQGCDCRSGGRLMPPAMLPGSARRIGVDVNAMVTAGVPAAFFDAHQPRRGAESKVAPRTKERAIMMLR